MTRENQLLSDLHLGDDWGIQKEGGGEYCPTIKPKKDRPRKTLDAGLSMLGIDQLRDQNCELDNRISVLEQVAFGSVAISSLGDSRVTVSRSLQLVVRRDGDDFIVSLIEANISSGGPDLPSAVANLQSLIAETFLDIKSVPDKSLGPSMKKQKQVLLELLCLKS